MVHIMRRLFPIVEYMLRRGGSALLHETHTKPFQAMVRNILIYAIYVSTILYSWHI